jgi:hypothetical protein
MELHIEHVQRIDYISHKSLCETNPIPRHQNDNLSFMNHFRIEAEQVMAKVEQA